MTLEKRLIIKGCQFALPIHLLIFFLRRCRFKINDDEIGKDDLAAWACVRLDRLQTGYRLVHLWDAFGNPSDGVLLVHIDKILT